jgi:hypothetical protein
MIPLHPTLQMLKDAFREQDGYEISFCVIAADLYGKTVYLAYAQGILSTWSPHPEDCTIFTKESAAQFLATMTPNAWLENVRTIVLGEE